MKNWVTLTNWKADFLEEIFNLHSKTGKMPSEVFIKVGKRKFFKILIPDKIWEGFLLEHGFEEKL